MSKAISCVLMIGSLGGARLLAQTPIPVRSIGPTVATSTENVGPGVTVRATSDGHVLVAAGARKRVYEFDSTLHSFIVIRDSATGTSTRIVGGSGLISYMGDSTLLPDIGASALLVLDPAGKQVRSIAPPSASDLFFLDVPSSFGHAGFDKQGRLVYHALLRTSPPAGKVSALTPDSAPLLRGDFDSRKIDTLGWLGLEAANRADLTAAENPAGGPPIRTFKMVINPFPWSDEWAMLTDGTIAMVREHDYHIDWIDPDGKRRSTGKMPIDWRRFTDTEKKQIADSAHAMAAERIRGMTAGPGGANPNMKVDISVVPDSEFPTFWPSISPGSVLADQENRLWILPTTSTNAANGFTYDVVDREGRVVERVQVPKGRVIVGFGARGAVYLARTEGAHTYLERAQLHPPR